MVDEDGGSDDDHQGEFSRREWCFLAILVVLSLLVILHHVNPLLFATYSPFHEPDPNACLGEGVEASPASLGLPAASGLEADGMDTDGDGLSDAREEEIGTSPIVADTDGDGLLDGVEVRLGESSDAIDGLDPLQRDVLVEVDETEGTNLHEGDRRRLKEAFAEAPVDNPDGSGGVNLHIVVDEAASCVPSSMSIEDYITHYQETEFDSEGYGFYHVILVNDVEGDLFTSNLQGIVRDGTHGAIVQDQGEGVTGATLMHELGHAMGLTDADFHGVDNDGLSAEEYPSVMNYNNKGAYEYSNGVGFDDWRYIERNQHYPPTAEIERLFLPDSENRSRWNDG